MPKLLLLIIIFCVLTNPIPAQNSRYHQLMTSGEKAESEKQYTAAISYYKEASSLASLQAEPWLRVIVCAIYQQDLSNYKTALNKLEKNSFSIPLDFYLTYSEIAQKQKKYTEALALISQIEKKFIHRNKLSLHKVDLLAKMHKTPEKNLLLQQLFNKNNKNSAVIYRLANSYFYSNPSESIHLYKQLLHEKKYTNIALLSLGKLYINQYKKTPEKANLAKAYDYYRLYANSHPRDTKIKKLLKELGNCAGGK